MPTTTTRKLTDQQLHTALIEAATSHRNAELNGNTTAEEVTARRLNDLLEELHTRRGKEHP